MSRTKRNTSWKPLRDGNTLMGIYTESQMGRLVEYEIARAGRINGDLSLVFFHLESTRRSRSRQFVDQIASMVRTTDHLGWFGDDRIAVLMPNTNGAGATSFAGQAVKDTGIQANRVYTYGYPEIRIITANPAESAGYQRVG